MTDYAPVLDEGPDALPVSVDEVKSHLRISGTDDDGMLAIYLAAAVDHLDGPRGWLRRAIVTQSWSQQFDAFASIIRLGLAPVSEIDVVTYLDASGVEQTVAEADYSLINGESDPHLRFATDYNVPTVQDDLPVLTITFIGGYGEPADVPASIRAAILLMVGDMYENREAKLASGVIENSTVRRLLDPYRRGWVA